MTYLFNRLKVVFHTLNSDIFASLDALSLQYFRESSLAFFADKPILLHALLSLLYILVVVEVFNARMTTPND